MAKLYIAGPYGRRSGATPEQCAANVAVAIAAARQLITWGHTPFVPHLYHYVHEGWECTPEEDRWGELCMAWIKDCDAIVMVGDWRNSVGSRAELRKALSLDLLTYKWSCNICIRQLRDGYPKEPISHELRHTLPS